MVQEITTTAMEGILRASRCQKESAPTDSGLAQRFRVRDRIGGLFALGGGTFALGLVREGEAPAEPQILSRGL